MNMSSWSEEDLKAKIIIPFFLDRDFNLSEMEFERPFRLTVGTKRISIHSDILVKIRGRPAIIVEVKKPDHKINDSDVEQAISYARLAENIVPFAMVTNLIETRLYDTYARSQISSIPSFANASSKHVTIDDELKFEALRNLFRLNYEFLQDFCQTQRKTQMLHLLNIKRGICRFDTSLYLNRSDFEREFKEFLKSKDKCFVLLGDQGIGKTFALISIAEDIGNRIPSLFYDAAYVPYRLADAIEEDFCWGRRQRTWIGDILIQIDEILRKHETQMVIFVDAINEPMPTNERKADLVNLIRRLYNTSIKLCLACRKQDWKFFFFDKGEPGPFSFVMYSPQFRESSGSEEIGSVQIADFSEKELDLVFPKYKEAFNLKGGLTKQAREICRHPETLRLVSEVYSGSAIPLNLRRRKVLDKYWLKKLESTGNPQIAEILLLLIGDIILKNRKLEIRDKTLFESIPWNETYQRIYEQAVSENFLSLRRDNYGNGNIRIIPNILAEYALARVLVDKYREQVQTSIVSFAEEISVNLKGFQLYEGILLLFCNMLDNPSELVPYLLKELDPEIVLDQVMDENPKVITYLLSEDCLRNEICRALLKQETSKIVRVLLKLLEKNDKTRTLAVELLMSHETQTHRERLKDLLMNIFRLSKFNESFAKIFDLLKEELKHKARARALGNRRTVDFLYRVNSFDPAMAKKLLSKFEIGELRSIVKSSSDRNEYGRSLYLLSKINEKVALRIDPSQKTLRDFKLRLKNRQVTLEDPLAVFRKESKPSKPMIWQQTIIDLLEANTEGYTWLQLADQTGYDKYKLLGYLEHLIECGHIHRENITAKVFTYKILRKRWVDEIRPRPPFAEYDPHVKEFVSRIVKSGFALNSDEIDSLLEDLMLGKYVSNWRTCYELSFEILSIGLDIAGQSECPTLETPGKVFCFWVNWLRKSGEFRQKLPPTLIKNMSYTAPRMFKNMILGIRTRQHHRQFKPISIQNWSQMEQRLKEFTAFFGQIGVRTPTEESVFEECKSTLKQLAGFDGPITNTKTIEFLNRVKEIFRRNDEIATFEMGIKYDNRRADVVDKT